MSQQNEERQKAIDVFLHPEGSKPVVAKTEADQTIGELLRNAGIEPGEDLHVFIGDVPDDASRDEVDEDDEIGPVRTDDRVKDVELKRHGHLTCHRCPVIKVSVEYNCENVGRRFRPTATVSRVIAWARRRLNLDEAAATDLVLRISGRNEDLRPDTRLGELVSGESCSLSFDLVAPALING